MPKTLALFADGVRLALHHWPASTASDHAFVLLHGFTNDSHIWGDLPSQLQAWGDVYALDFRGHGDSEWDPQARYRPPQLQADLDAVMALLPQRTLHLIGHSLGARVALIHTLTRQWQPASMVLIDTGPIVRASGVRKVRQDAEAQPAYYADFDSYAAPLRRSYALAQTEALERLVIANGARQTALGWQSKTDPAFTRALWHANSQRGDASDLSAPLVHELWQALDQVRGPALVLRGALSAILSRTTWQEMGECLAQPTLQEIERAGHALMVDQPAAFVAAVIDFYQGLISP